MKYKLKQIYPGSPKLGTIAKKDNKSPSYYNFKNEDEKECLHYSEIENYPEFWQKVVEKDYEILSLICNQNLRKLIKGEIIYKQNDDTFKGVSNCGQNIPIFSNSCEEIILKLDHWSIHSVKRLSDGEIFTIGDNTDFGTITGIGFDKNQTELWLDFQTKTVSHGGYSMNNYQTLQKAKTPLFTTEDGVDIFEGDEFYFIPQNFNCKGYNNGIGSLIADKNIIAKFAEARFSTLEKAEEYILLNKPCLSLKNIADLSLKSYTTIDLGIKLRDLVKSKIQQSV